MPKEFQFIRWNSFFDSFFGLEGAETEGETGEVESIEFEQTSQEMYNLTVDEAHTFYVGDGQWLVHNACPTRWADSDLWQSVKINYTSPGEKLAYELVEKSRYHDMETHILSTMHWSADYGRYLGYSDREIINIARGAGLHDIGKGFHNLAPYFNSTGGFNPIMRTHAARGANFLDWLGVDKEIANVARWHHPKYVLEGVDMPYWDDIGYLTQPMVPADTLSASMFPRGYTEDLGPMGNFNRGMQWLGGDVSRGAIPQSVVDNFGSWFQMYYGLK